MTEVRLVKFRIKPGRAEQWIAWCKELERRRDESVATLKNEGVVSESCFLSQDGHTYYFMEAHNMKKTKKAVATHPHPIDLEHRKHREECLEKVEEVAVILHIENHD